jgi:hypothetical protein
MGVLQYVIERFQPYLPWVLIIVLILVSFRIHQATHEEYGFRITGNFLWHVLTVGLGWWIGKIPGIFFVSLPVLFIYYYFLFHLALVIIPCSDPDDPKEWRQRFRLFMWYQWGYQYPLWAVTDALSRNAEVRIGGDQFGGFAPGLIWAYSHQVAGLTTGLTFSGTREAGTVLTNPFEEPFSVIDLRTQLRTSLIEVISSDGIPFKARLYAAFATDKERWSPSLYHQLVRENPILKNAQEPDCIKGTYRFSHARMLALFNKMGVVSSSKDQTTKPTTIEWDQWVVFQLEKAAREVLSQRRLDELWQPHVERAGVNAMDDIANDIKDTCSFELRQHGVKLYSCRIVDFEFPKPEPSQIRGDDVRQKHIATWSADWQREAEQTRAEGKADADLLIQEARAYAYTNLLTAVAEGFQETRLLNPNLPRYVIAIRFIGALERLIEEQPDTEDFDEARSSLTEAKKMLPWMGDADKMA